MKRGQWHLLANIRMLRCFTFSIGLPIKWRTINSAFSHHCFFLLHHPLYQKEKERKKKEKKGKKEKIKNYDRTDSGSSLMNPSEEWYVSFAAPSCLFCDGMSQIRHLFLAYRQVSAWIDKCSHSFNAYHHLNITIGSDMSFRKADYTRRDKNESSWYVSHPRKRGKTDYDQYLNIVTFQQEY